MVFFPSFYVVRNLLFCSVIPSKDGIVPRNLFILGCHVFTYFLGKKKKGQATKKLVFSSHMHPLLIQRYSRGLLSSQRDINLFLQMAINYFLISLKCVLKLSNVSIMQDKWCVKNVTMKKYIARCRGNRYRLEGKKIWMKVNLIRGDWWNGFRLKVKDKIYRLRHV